MRLSSEWSLAVLALIAVALTGTGCGGDATDPPPKTDASAVSPASSADELFDTQFAQVCRETGQAAAATYNPSSELHPILVLRSDNGTEYHQASVTLPDGWAVVWPNLGRTELVGCVRRVSATPVQICEGYSNEDSGSNWTVQTHDVVYDYEVRVARTAKVLADTTFEISAGSCPMFSSYRTGDPQPQPYYPSIGDGEAELFVRRFVTGT